MSELNEKDQEFLANWMKNHKPSAFETSANSAQAKWAQEYGKALVAKGFVLKAGFESVIIQEVTKFCQQHGKDTDFLALDQHLLKMLQS